MKADLAKGKSTKFKEISVDKFIKIRKEKTEEPKAKRD
jgi:hypothetical protein